MRFFWWLRLLFRFFWFRNMPKNRTQKNAHSVLLWA
jgi:hypothetical protein